MAGLCFNFIIGDEWHVCVTKDHERLHRKVDDLGDDITTLKCENMRLSRSNAYLTKNLDDGLAQWNEYITGLYKKTQEVKELRKK